MKTHASPRAQARRGFTLIELLTVIAIIGILAAILIPVVGSVRKKAQAANCMSNLRQIGTAMQLYAEANKGFLPAPQDDDNINGATPVDWWTKWWMYQTQPYLEKRMNRDDRLMLNFGGVFRCPGKSEWDLSQTPDGYKISYAMNIFDVKQEGPLARKYRRNLRQFANPSQTMLVMDQAALKPDGSVATTNVIPYLQSNRAVYRDQIDLRHNNKSNVLFVDGHVESLPQWGLNYWLMKDPNTGPSTNDTLKPF